MSLKTLRFSLLVVFLLVQQGFLFAQDHSAKLAEIDAYAKKVREDWSVPGFAVAIVKDDKLIFAKGYGVRSLGKPDAVDENTLFAIASNSKAFTTASLAILIDEKKLNWDDKVSKYVPEFQMYDPYVTREITIRDLVCHRSGLDTFSGDLLWYQSTYSSDEIIRRIRYLKPVSSFRAQYGYQNLMYIVAGKVIERVSGKKWSEFVSERILKPLGMERTLTSAKQLKDNFSAPHNESSGKLAPLRFDDADNADAAAGLLSSAKDISQWLRLQLGRGSIDGKIIFSKERSAEMWAQNSILGVNPFPAKNAPTQIFSGYGLGWFLADYRGHKMISHGGGLDGMISQTAMIPDENLGIAVFTNSETGVNTIMQNKIFDVFLNVEPKRDWSAERLERAKLGKAREAEEAKKLEESRVQNTRPSLPLSGYTGTYSGGLYGDAAISEENGKLILKLLPSPNFTADLEHWHYDTFRIKWRSSVVYNFSPGFVNFSLDGKGKVAEMKIDQPNNDFWFYELDFKKTK